MDISNQTEEQPTYIETNVQHLDEVAVDLSGGCQHIRDVVEEMGEEWETFHTERTISTVDGTEGVEVYYDEMASVYRPWFAFKYGYGSRSGASREEAIEHLMKMIGEKQ